MVKQRRFPRESTHPRKQVQKRKDAFLEQHGKGLSFDCSLPDMAKHTISVDVLPDGSLWINLEIFQQVGGIGVTRSNVALGEHTHTELRN